MQCRWSEHQSTTIPQIDKAFEDLCDIIVKTTEEIVPKRKIKKRKPKLQIMSEDILKAIELVPDNRCQNLCFQIS
jgi:hemerythrin